MKIIQGDILTKNTSDKYVLVCHQVNCQGVMGSGLAKQIKQKHYGCFEMYYKKCSHISDSSELLGSVQYYDAMLDSGYFIANIFGQNYYGRDKQYTDYDALAMAFGYISYCVRKGEPNWTVRIPYMFGCGLGGGDWDIVSEIIKKTLVDNGVDVEIWQLPTKS